MALISLRDISVHFGETAVLDRLDMQIEEGERVALLGRNGCGKTTLMKVMSGLFQPDSGEVVYQKGLKVGFLPQEVPFDMSGNVLDIVLSGLGDIAVLLAEYQRLSHIIHESRSSGLLSRLDSLQAKLDHAGGWDLNNRAETVISRMKLDASSDFSSLSGGQKRRVLLARALVLHPDVILLDEPTNHLDIDSIGWLEGFLRNYRGTVFFVTHDRVFMEHLAGRIMELDRGSIMSWNCDYKTFLQRKQAALDIEESRRAQFDKKLAQEEQWIRQGVKARRCRNEGRVKALESLREEKKAMRNSVGLARMHLQETDPSGRLVVKAVHAGFSYGDNCIIRDLTAQILRGDKIGIIGPNGSGKTTLLRLLLGKIQPDSGKIRLGTNLEISYFDQLREQLDENKTVAENVCGAGEMVTINGKARHIISYLQDFLFTPDRARTPISVLSGGERNRLLLARLFTKPSNLLVMDEPTNDLDIETLELLEDLLLEYSGTLLLVSHDRAFLNNVVTSTLVLEGEGAVNEYPGGYDDWLAQRKPVVVRQPSKKETAEKIRKPIKPPSAKKLTFNEKRELESLPASIESMENELHELYSSLADVAFYKRDPKDVSAARQRSLQLTREIADAYKRWEYLESLVDKG